MLEVEPTGQCGAAWPPEVAVRPCGRTSCVSLFGWLMHLWGLRRHLVSPPRGDTACFQWPHDGMTARQFLLHCQTIKDGGRPLMSLSAMLARHPPSRRLN